MAGAAEVDSPEQYLPIADTTEYKTSPRDALVNIVYKALRAEAGVRYRQETRENTSYYAGRRAGFVCSAAVIMEQLYSVDYEEAKNALRKRVQQAGEEWVPADLVDPARGGQLATEIVSFVVEGRV